MICYYMRMSSHAAHKSPKRPTIPRTQLYEVQPSQLPERLDLADVQRWREQQREDAQGYANDPEALRRHRRNLRIGVGAGMLAIAAVVAIGVTGVIKGLHEDASRPSPVYTTNTPYSPAPETASASPSPSATFESPSASASASASANASSSPSKASASPSQVAKPAPTATTASAIPSPSHSAAAGACKVIEGSQVVCNADETVYSFDNPSTNSADNPPMYTLPANAAAEINCSATSVFATGDLYNVTFNGQTGWLPQSAAGKLCQ